MAKIYRKSWPRVRAGTNNGKSGFWVDSRGNGISGKRAFFTNQKKALKRASEIEADFLREGKDGAEISSELRVAAIQADEILKPYGRTILEAANHYRNYLDTLLTRENSMSIAELADKWVEAKRSAKKKIIKELTLKNIADTARLIKETFPEKKILEVSETDIENLVYGMSVGLRRRFNVTSLLSQFFNWCIKARYTTENPAESVKKEIDPPARGTIEILNPEKAKEFMTIAENEFPSLVIYNALLLFAGLRPFCAQRLEWSDINLETRKIHVRLEITKTNEERTVDIEDNLLEWLIKYRPEDTTGFVTRRTNFSNIIKKYRVRLGYNAMGENENAPKYQPDVARHSFASYWLSKYNDRAKLAEQMGNSREIIKRYYKKLVGKAETKAYWSIYPKGISPKRPEYPILVLKDGSIVEDE